MPVFKTGAFNRSATPPDETHYTWDRPAHKVAASFSVIFLEWLAYSGQLAKAQLLQQPCTREQAGLHLSLLILRLWTVHRVLLSPSRVPGSRSHEPCSLLRVDHFSGALAEAVWAPLAQLAANCPSALVSR